MKVQSDQGLHGLVYRLYHLDTLLCRETALFKFFDNYNNFLWGCPNFSHFHGNDFFSGLIHRYIILDNIGSFGSNAFKS